jgi:hypothetical membrane protein
MRESPNGPSARLPSADKAADYRNTGILFSLGGLLFLLLNTAAEAIYPGFSLQTNAMSDLAAVGVRTFILEEAAILGAGICWTAGAYYLLRRTGRRGALVLNALPGVGFLLAGLSPENVNVAIHSAGALLAFPFGGIVVILSYRTIQSRFRYLSIALGALSLASTFTIFAGGQLVGPCGSCAANVSGYTQKLEELVLGLGGWESMIIFPLLIWLIGYGSYLMAAGRSGR